MWIFSMHDFPIEKQVIGVTKNIIDYLYLQQVNTLEEKQIGV